jgi:hypothetical protein
MEQPAVAIPSPLISHDPADESVTQLPPIGHPIIREGCPEFVDGLLTLVDGSWIA